jgi:hypothetical protein
MLLLAGTYRMRAVLRAGKVGHAVNTRESGAATTIPVWIEFLLRQDITTVLWIYGLDSFGQENNKNGRLVVEKNMHASG